MDRQRLEELIVDYLDGTLNPEQEAELRGLLAQHGYNVSDLNELGDLQSMLGELPAPEPGARMHAKFYSMLEEEKHAEENSLKNRIKRSIFGLNDTGQRNEKKRSFLIPQIVYSFVLILIGWGIGNFTTPGSQYQAQLTAMSSEIREMRSVMMLTMLSQPSASERLKAVSQVDMTAGADSRIIDALLKTVDTDPNVNVRLVAVEALHKMSADPKVRTGLVQSIAKQDSPLMQLALADVMVAMNENSAIPELAALLEKPHLYYGVRNTIEKAINTLSGDETVTE